MLSVSSYLLLRIDKIADTIRHDLPLPISRLALSRLPLTYDTLGDIIY